MHGSWQGGPRTTLPAASPQLHPNCEDNLTLHIWCDWIRLYQSNAARTMIDRPCDSRLSRKITILAASAGPLRLDQGCSAPSELLNDFLSEHAKSNAAVEQTKVTLLPSPATVAPACASERVAHKPLAFSFSSYTRFRFIRPGQ